MKDRFLFKAIFFKTVFEFGASKASSFSYPCLVVGEVNAERAASDSEGQTVPLLYAVYPWPACLPAWVAPLDASEPLRAQTLLESAQSHPSE